MSGLARTGADAARSLVITGVSTGIGHSVARLAIAHGWRVFGSVRSEADAERLMNEFGAAFTPLLFDVRDEAAVFAAAKEVRASLGSQTLNGLVNNAGVGFAGPLLHQPLDEFRTVIDTNVLGTLMASRAFAPLLGADQTLSGKKGRIVNITSIAGKIGQPFAGAYVASKFALEGLSESLRRELMLFGIDVIIVAPGAVKTPIWSKADEIDVSGYRNSPFFPALERVRKFMLHLGEIGLPPEKIAAAIAEALTSPRPKVRYQITPDPMRHLILSLLPKRTVDKIIAKRLGLVPPA